MGSGTPVLRPDTPEEIPGNIWYSFLIGVSATDEPREIVIQWPDVKPWPASDYNDNDTFAEVLDRVIFMDCGDGRWQRIDQVTRTDLGTLVTVPPGSDGRRLAVGMPVTQQDLTETLSFAGT
jgi:hypothetical protein